MPIAILILSILAAALSPLNCAWGARLNSGLLYTQANDDADLTLSDIPRNMTNPSDIVVISWTPDNVSGQIKFSSEYAGETPDGYGGVVEEPIESIGGRIRFRGDQLPVGYLYCIVDGGRSGYSVVFNMIRIADNAPGMVAPITAAGRQGINTVTPTFRWEAVNGVPFYHIIVSDQPFVITEDENGTRVEGSNVIWQAITSQTFIQFGLPDPAEFFDNDQVPPLVGSMDRGDRPRYAWLVLNNYGNHPAYSSTVSGGVSGFEVEVAPPFDEPENISPETRSTLNSDEVVFRWTEVEEAVSYFVYVSREEITQGGSQALVPAWSAQTTLTSIACPASDVLSNARYVWKVLAASRQGRGTLSDTSSFSYDIRSGDIVIYSRTLDGNPLEFTEIQVESVNGPGVAGLSTDDAGFVQRTIPLGTYYFHALKNGYVDTVSARVTIEEDQQRTVVLRLRQIPTSIVGTAADENGDPIGQVTVTATPVQGGDATSAETNISGSYQLVVPPGNYRINATANGRRPAEERTVQVANGQNVDLDADGGPLVLDLYRYTISGYVRNGAGQPISTATITAVSADGNEVRMYTPESGFYSFLAGRGVWTLNAVKPGFYLESGEVEAEVNDRNLDISFTLLPQAGIFSGQVMVDGSPANRNAEVWFIPSAGQITTSPVSQIGAFSRGVSPGNYVAVAVREGYHTSDSLRLSVDPGETISGLRLELEANPASISGRIVDAGGNALREARVAASGVAANSDANGNYTLRVAAGSHTITATKDAYVTAQRGPVSVQAGQDLQNIDLRLLDNAGTITGVVKRGRDAIFDAVITATRQGGDGARFTTRSDRDGRYSFGLTFGSYRLTVQKDGFIASAPGYIDVQLQAGQNVNGRDFPMLSYSARIVGNVSSPAGAVNTPTIRITDLDDQNISYSTNGNIQGDYAVAVTPERRYIITATKVGFNVVTDTTQRLEIEGEVVVNKRLTPLPCVVSGTITVGGTALSGAVIRAEGQAGTFQSNSDRSGRFAISMQPGAYQVSASKPGYTLVQQDLRINPGEDRNSFDFALERNFALVSGTVRDPDGNGVSTATVTVIDSINQRSRTTQTDNDGIYELTDIIPGNYYLIATHERYRNNAQNLGALIGRQERRGINIVVAPLAAMITGRVTSGGNGIPSATVYATEEGGETFSALTNNNGNYSIANMSGGLFSVLPAKVGYTGVTRGDIRVNPADTVAINLDMVANDGQITGVVRDPDGTGLRDVRVTAVDSLGNFTAATTNAAGQYSLDNMYPLTRYKLNARLTGYTPEQDTIPNVANHASVTIRLLPNELRLSGRVVNQVGTGIASTDLTAVSQTDGSTFRATSNQVGDFAFVGLAASTSYRIQTQRAENFYVNADTTVRIAANHLNLGPAIRIIQRTASVRGRITSSNQGVIDVSLGTRNIHTGRQRSTYTGGDGTYRVLNLRGGDLGDIIIRASKLGYVVRQPDSIRVSGLGISEERPNVNFIVDQILVDISGRVVDSTGAAMGFVPMVLWSESGQSADTTDANGGFIFTDQYPNQRYSVSTDLPREGYQNASQEVDAALNDISNISLSVIRHNATVTGFVRTEQGAPVPLAAVRLDNGDPVRTDTSGAFTFQFVAGGSHQLEVSKAGYLTVTTAVNTANGEGIYSRTISIVALDRAVYGTITSKHDRTNLPGVVMTLASNTGDTLRDTSGVNGTFQFNGLDPAKTYSVRSYRKDYEVFNRADLSIADGNIELTFALYPPNRGIYGRVVASDGEPVPGAIVRARSFANQVVRDTTDYFGDYHLQPETGTQSVLAIASPPFSGNSRNVNVEANGNSWVRLDLPIEQTSRASGRLVLEDGTAPLTTGRIIASHNATGDIFFNFTANDGSFDLRGLRAGNYSLSAEAAGYAMVVNPFQFEVQQGETATLTIGMTQSGKAITGYVRDGDGKGVARAHVTVTGNSSGTFETNGEGYWTLAGPLAGRYTISVSRNGYDNPADTTFDLVAGSIVEVNRTIIPTPNALSGHVIAPNATPFRNGAIYRHQGGQVVDSVFTDQNGDYIFHNLDPVRQEVRVNIPGYVSTPASIVRWFEDGSYFLDQDFALGAAGGFAIVHGVITHGNDPVSAEVNIVDMVNSSRLGTKADDSGLYRIQRIPTPSTFKLTANYPGVPSVSTEPFALQIGEDLSRAIQFPQGQIRVKLLNSEGQPIVGRRVFVSGLSLDYTAILYSDGTGFAETPNWLPAGSFTVTPEALSGMLPPSPEIVDLQANETRELTWYLGWRFTPPPPFSFEDSARVEIKVPGQVAIADASLYVKGPGAAQFSAIQLQSEAGGGVPGRGSRSVYNSEPLRDNSDATVTWFGYIPPQGRSGTLLYYLQVTTVDGYVFGGPESVQDITVSARGLLDHLKLLRTQTALTPRVGVPVKLTVTAYDDGNNDLTSRLRTEGRFEWYQIGEPLGTLEVDPSDSSIAIYYPESIGDAEIRARVIQSSTAVSVAASLQWTNSNTKVSRLQVSATGFQIKAGDSLKFTVTANDSSGALVPVATQWTTTPPEVASISPLPFSTQAWLTTTRGQIGKVRVTASDTLSNIEADYNDDSPDRSQHGLTIFGELSSSSTDTTYFRDGLGFKIKIPPGSFTTSALARIFLNEPILTPVFRLTPLYELASTGYNITVEGNLSPDAGYILTIPVPATFKLERPTVGSWNSERIDWDVLEGEFNSDSTEVILEVSSLNGLYALLSSSEALGVRDLKFSPNPFSPQASTSGLAIEFHLTSDIADYPSLSVMVYNMQGQLVRKLIDSRLMPKGDYRRGGENELIWDGKTDDNLMARNGRYIIVLTAKDASGEAKEIGSAVLVK